MLMPLSTSDKISSGIWKKTTEFKEVKSQLEQLKTMLIHGLPGTGKSSLIRDLGFNSGAPGDVKQYFDIKDIKGQGRFDRLLTKLGQAKKQGIQLMIEADTFDLFEVLVPAPVTGKNFHKFVPQLDKRAKELAKALNEFGDLIPSSRLLLLRHSDAAVLLNEIISSEGLDSAFKAMKPHESEDLKASLLRYARISEDDIPSLKLGEGKGFYFLRDLREGVRNIKAGEGVIDSGKAEIFQSKVTEVKFAEKALLVNPAILYIVALQATAAPLSDIVGGALSSFSSYMNRNSKLLEEIVGEVLKEVPLLGIGAIFFFYLKKKEKKETDFRNTLLELASVWKSLPQAKKEAIGECYDVALGTNRGSTGRTFDIISGIANEKLESRCKAIEDTLTELAGKQADMEERVKGLEKLSKEAGVVLLANTPEDFETYYNISQTKLVRERSGRAQLLDEFVDAIEHWKETGSTIFVITGPPLIGKSSLAFRIATKLSLKHEVYAVADRRFSFQNIPKSSKRNVPVFILDDYHIGFGRGVSGGPNSPGLNPHDLYDILRSSLALKGPNRFTSGPLLLSISKSLWEQVTNSLWDPNLPPLREPLNEMVTSAELQPMNHAEADELIDLIVGRDFRGVLLSRSIRLAIIKRSAGNPGVIRLFFEGTVRREYEKSLKVFTVTTKHVDEIDSDAETYVLTKLLDLYFPLRSQHGYGPVLRILYPAAKFGEVSIGYIDGVRDQLHHQLEDVARWEIYDARDEAADLERVPALFEEWGIMKIFFPFHGSVNRAILDIVEDREGLVKRLSDQGTQVASLDRQKRIDSTIIPAVNQVGRELNSDGINSRKIVHDYIHDHITLLNHSFEEIDDILRDEAKCSQFLSLYGEFLLIVLQLIIRHESSGWGPGLQSPWGKIAMPRSTVDEVCETNDAFVRKFLKALESNEPYDGIKGKSARQLYILLPRLKYRSTEVERPARAGPARTSQSVSRMKMLSIDIGDLLGMVDVEGGPGALGGGIYSKYWSRFLEAFGNERDRFQVWRSAMKVIDPWESHENDAAMKEALRLRQAKFLEFLESEDEYVRTISWKWSLQLADIKVINAIDLHRRKRYLQRLLGTKNTLLRCLAWSTIDRLFYDGVLVLPDISPEAPKLLKGLSSGNVIVKASAWQLVARMLQLGALKPNDVRPFSQLFSKMLWASVRLSPMQEFVEVFKTERISTHLGARIDTLCLLARYDALGIDALAECKRFCLTLLRGNQGGTSGDRLLRDSHRHASTFDIWNDWERLIDSGIISEADLKREKRHFLQMLQSSDKPLRWDAWGLNPWRLVQRGILLPDDVNQNIRYLDELSKPDKLEKQMHLEDYLAERVEGIKKALHEQPRQHIFSVPEANALIPFLRTKLEQINKAKEVADDFRKANRLENAAREPKRPKDRANWNRLEALYEECMKVIGEVEQKGVILGGINPGECDFPSMKDGEEVYLCWRDSDTEVAFWHRPTVHEDDLTLSLRKPLVPVPIKLE